MTKKVLIKNILYSLRIFGFLEGISYVVLFLWAMPLKYLFDDPSFIYPVGMAHGALFIGFLVYLSLASILQKWKIKEFILGGLSSLIPFGTFVFDAKILKHKIIESKSVSG